MKPVELALLKTLVNNIPKPKDGLDGKDGVDGLQGLQGKQGEVGKQGPSGLDGLDGKDGRDGLDGIDGKDGRDGLNGAIGKKGADGLDGPSGPKGEDGRDGTDGTDGKDGRGIKSVKVNEKNMLVVTYDDGEMAIAGKVSVTREATTVGGGLPLGSFGITGTKINDAGELIILGTWGKEFNTGFTSSGGVTLRNPTFTYTSGALTSVAYTGGHTKVLAYNGDGTLNTVVTTINGQATTKTLAYNLDGSLASVTES